MTILSALFLVATIAYLTLMVMIVVRNPRSSLNWVCAGVLLCLGFWGFTDIFHNNIRLSVERIRFFANLGSLGWCSFPSLLFLYSLILTRRRRVLRNWLTYPPLVAASAFFVYLQWTGHLGVDYTLQTFGWVTVWARSAWPMVYFAYPVLSAAGAVWVIADSRRHSAIISERRQNRVLIITILAPILFGALTNVVLPLLTTVRFPELAPILGLVWAAGLYYSASHYGLLTFSPRAAADEILSTMVDALLLLAPDNRIVNVNRSTQELLGYRKSELMGRSAETLFALPGQFRDEARQVLAGHEIRQQEIIALARTGRELPVSISARIMRDSSGIPLGSVWVLHDMTMHRESENETRRLADGLNALNRLAVDLAAAPADLDLYRFLAERLKIITGAIAVNTSEYLPAAREMRIRHLAVDSGLLTRVNQVLGKSIINLSMPVTPESYDRVVNATVGSAGDLFEITFGAIPRPLGIVIQKMLGIDYFTGLAFAHHGELLGTAVISARAGYPTPHPDVLRTFANIAAVALHRKRLEDAMRDSEEFHRSLVERANDGIVIIQDQVVRYANTRLRQMWGDAEANLEGTPFTDFIDPGEIPKLARRYQQRIAGEAIPATYETVLRHRDGSRIYVELNAGVITLQGKPADLVIIRDVTERRSAALVIHESEENFRVLAERANDAIFISDAQGRHVFANERAAALTGYPTSELLTTRFRDLVRPEDISWLETRAAARLRGEPQPSQYEITVRRKDGQEIPLELSVTRTYWRGAPATLVVARDITERKRAEAALRESEERYRNLVEDSPEPIVVHQEGVVLFSNQAAANFLGAQDPAELAGQPLWNFLDRTAQQLVRQRVRQMLDHGRSLPNVEETFVRQDGTTRIAEVASTSTKYQGAPAVQMMVRDITDRKRADAELLALRDRLEEQVRVRTADLTLVNRQLQGEVEEHRQVEEQLRESEVRFHGVFEKATTGMCLTGADGRFLDVNQSLCQMLEYTHAELAATGFAVVTHPDDLPASRECVRSLLAGERETYHFEKRYLKKSGSVVWTDVSTILVRAPEGAPLYFITHIHDITERRQTEDRVRQLNRELEAAVVQLEAANKELESFSYSVSHDLRAPLRSLDGFSQALLDDYRDRLDAPGKDHLNRIRAASQRMAQLIDDLLKLSRVTRSELHLEPLNLSQLAQGIIKELSQAEPNRTVAVVVAPDLQATGDARLLRILLANLLGNAWKFTAHQPAPKIELGVLDNSSGPRPPTSNPRCPVFYVRDNGAGFDMAYVNKLFTAFQRLHGVEEFPGSGIGLATAQRIALRHGGKIWAEGTPGQGATFYFTLAP